MNCNNCINLIENQCKLGKHETLGRITDDFGNIEQLLNDCIFKNTQHKDVTFKQSHQLAMSNIAIASYFILTKTNYNDFINLLAKENEYIDGSPIGQFNVIIESLDFNPQELKDIANKLNEVNHKFNHRLWTLSIPEPIDLDRDNPLEIPQFILNHCRLPYFMILQEEKNFADAHNFKYKCFSGPIPKIFGPVISIKYARKITEDAETETQYSI